MTEGHAAHAIAGRLGAFAGRRVLSRSPAGRIDAAIFDGAHVERAEAVGKNLLVRFADVEPVVHVHLAMRGRLSVRRHRRALDGDLPRTQPPVRGDVAWRLLSATHHAELTDPAVCALLHPDAERALFERLGPDPLRADADPDRAFRRITRSRRPIGLLFVDQGVVAGVGNVYRAELLHRAGLDPFRPGRAVDPGALERLWVDTVDLMTVGRDAGRIVTTEPDLRAARDALVRGERVPRRPRLYAVYGRAGRPCPACGSTVRAAPLGRQRVFWCPTCQPGT